MTLAWIAAAFVLGVILRAPLPALLVGAVALACGLAAWRLPALRLLSLLLLALCLGSARSAERQQGDPLRAYEGQTVQLQGIVDEEPDIRDTGANYTVRVLKVGLTGALRAAWGQVQVHTSRAVVFEYGDVVSLQGRLVRPSDGGSVPVREVLARRGITATMDFPRALATGHRGMGPLSWVMPLRQRLEAGIDAWLPEPEAALLIAISLGARSASLGDLAPLLITTGLIHIIAISGIKVAMVAGMVQRAARAAWARTLSYAVGLMVLWMYVVLTGATVSGVRSALMWTLVFVGAYLGRGTVALVSLSLAAAGMVAVDPSLPWDPAFLMSTLGTLAIVAYSDPIIAAIPWVPSPVKEAFGVTLAAQVGTLPVVVLSFHVVALTGPVANALVLPLLPVLIVAGFAVGALASWPIIVAPLAAATASLLHAVLLLVGAFAALAGALPAISLPWPVIALYYAAAALAGRHFLRRAHWAPSARRPAVSREALLGTGLALSAVTASSFGLATGPPPRLTWLGTGNALLLQQGDRTVLIDGSARPYLLLERLGQTLPFGRRSLDVVVVTDPRASNVAGLTEVLRHYRIGEVLDVGAEYPSSTYSSWRSVLRRSGVPVYALRTGASLRLGSARLEALGPDAVYSNPRDSIGMLRHDSPGRRC
jgi:competence protein ComEC